MGLAMYLTFFVSLYFRIALHTFEARSVAVGVYFPRGFLHFQRTSTGNFLNTGNTQVIRWCSLLWHCLCASQKMSFLQSFLIKDASATSRIKSHTIVGTCSSSWVVTVSCLFSANKPNGLNAGVTCRIHKLVALRDSPCTLLGNPHHRSK